MHTSFALFVLSIIKCCIFLPFLQIGVVTGETLVRLQLLDYFNSFGITEQGDCCDGIRSTVAGAGCVQDQCDHKLTVCISDPTSYRLVSWLSKYILNNKIVKDCSNLPYTHNTYTQEYPGWHISYADTYNVTNKYTNKICNVYAHTRTIP